MLLKLNLGRQLLKMPPTQSTLTTLWKFTLDGSKVLLHHSSESKLLKNKSEVRILFVQQECLKSLLGLINLVAKPVFEKRSSLNHQITVVNEKSCLWILWLIGLMHIQSYTLQELSVGQSREGLTKCLNLYIEFIFLNWCQKVSFHIEHTHLHVNYFSGDCEIM